MISSIFIEQNARRLEINCKEKTIKKHKHMAVKQQQMSHWKNQRGN